MKGFCNRKKKLVVLVWPEGHPNAGEIVAVTNNYYERSRPAGPVDDSVPEYSPPDPDDKYSGATEDDVTAYDASYMEWMHSLAIREDRQRYKYDLPWEAVEIAIGVEDENGIEAVPVAIVECDGSSKLNIGRIGPGNGEPPECRVEACMEVSADRSSPQDLPIDNTFGQARSLVAKAKEQGFPLRRLHHHSHDHQRCHCIGRLVRK